MVAKKNMENTKDTKKIDQKDPHMLAWKAKKELFETGRTTIKCPKCGEAPELTRTPKGERTIVACRCGYIHDEDINF